MALEIKKGFTTRSEFDAGLELAVEVYDGAAPIDNYLLEEAQDLLGTGRVSDGWFNSRLIPHFKQQKDPDDPELNASIDTVIAIFAEGFHIAIDDTEQQRAL